MHQAVRDTWRQKNSLNNDRHNNTLHPRPSLDVTLPFTGSVTAKPAHCASAHEDAACTLTLSRVNRAAPTDTM